MTSPPDVAYIIGPGNNHNPELRYSLRSVAANLPHRNIVIVGHKPAWVTNVTHIPTMQASRIKYGNALRNMLAFCENDQLTPTVTFFNDDFYAMHHGQPAPIQHRGTIHDMLNRQLTHKNRLNNDYLEGMRQAQHHLQQLGIDQPLSYELHQPMPINRAMFHSILVAYDPDLLMPGVAKRSLYGNLANIGGTPTPDPRPIRHGYWTWPWISTNDNGFKPGLPARILMEHRFPQPCQYETPGAPTTTTTAFINTAPKEQGGGRYKIIQPGDRDTIRKLARHPSWQPV